MRTRRTFAFCLPLILLLGASACSGEKAASVPAKVVVSDAWTREADAGQKGAAYVTVVNEGSEPDKLLSVSVEGIQLAEVHNHIHDGQGMRMIAVPALEIPASGKLTFQPGGLHIMLMGLSEPIVEGETLHMILKFEKTGIVATEAKVLTTDQVLERVN